jgi:Holliday junction resolvase RusA-like endonuclease
MAGRSPTDRPVAVSMLAVFPIPKSITKAKLAGIQAGFIPCQASADLDNVFKSVADAMNKIVFVDDSQVVQMTAKKLYGEEPRVVVSVREFLPADLLGD